MPRRIIQATMKAVLPLIFLVGFASTSGAVPYCFLGEIKDWAKAKEAFDQVCATGQAEKAPYYYESVRLYLEFAKIECMENHTSSASDAARMALTRAREAGWLPADK